MAGWVLSIDFGTSYTTAAVRRDGGRPEPIDIAGERRVPSVILVEDDGSLVVGTAAENLSAARPGRTLREPKRNVGEPTPVILGGRAYPISDLIAALLAHVYEEAVRYGGGPPSEVRLTHPASWGRPRIADLRRAAQTAGISNPVLVPEPVAAAVSYASQASEDTGRYVAVYDLGGGTFDTAVLRSIDDSFVVAGRPGGDPRLGGELFDGLLVNHILGKIPADAAEALQTSDELGWRQAAGALRSDARAAKEALSSQEYTDVLLGLPTGLTQVRVTRGELEELVKDHVAESVELIGRNVVDAGLEPNRLDAIFLVGGASRMPIVNRLLEDEFPGVPISLRGDPKMAVALGATLPEAVSALDSTAEVPPDPVGGARATDPASEHIPLAGVVGAGTVAAGDPGAARTGEIAVPATVASMAVGGGGGAGAPPPDVLVAGDHHRKRRRGALLLSGTTAMAIMVVIALIALTGNNGTKLKVLPADRTKPTSPAATINYSPTTAAPTTTTTTTAAPVVPTAPPRTTTSRRQTVVRAAPGPQNTGSVKPAEPVPTGPSPVIPDDHAPIVDTSYPNGPEQSLLARIPSYLYPGCGRAPNSIPPGTTANIRCVYNGYYVQYSQFPGATMMDAYYSGRVPAQTANTGDCAINRYAEHAYLHKYGSGRVHCWRNPDTNQAGIQWTHATLNIYSIAWRNNQGEDALLYSFWRDNASPCC